MKVLTKEGQAYAEAHPEDLLCRVALYGVEWPIEFRNAAVATINQTAKEARHAV